MEGRTVVQHQGGPHAQAADQPVPHHPAAGGEVEQHILAPQIAVQQVFLELVGENAGMALDHALGLARGAGAVHHVEGMLGRHLDEIDLAGE
jgi:hypothetical protein